MKTPKLDMVLPFRLSREDFERLQTEAAEYGLNGAQVIRLAIRAAIETNLLDKTLGRVVGKRGGGGEVARDGCKT